MSSNQEKKSGVEVVHEDVRKEDTKVLVVTGSEAFPEDEFAGMYEGSASASGPRILEPMYKPGTLHALSTQNNTLGICIEAMEVNIDGTGDSIVLKEGGTENKAEQELLQAFFSNPYPGKTMKSIRRLIRRDREETGNGYMEVFRTADGEVAMIDHIDASCVRLCRLDDPVPVERTILRKGEEKAVTMMVRERRFVQIIGTKKVYFKEYGASRDLNRHTGEWSAKGSLALLDRASELIHFPLKKEPKTAYGVPRWVSQMPSVLGSRKAEEFNLEFFDANGIPPAMVIVEGGNLGSDSRREIKEQAAAKNGSRRLAIVEAVSTSGSLDSSGSVRVRVERFGAERQSDAMFQSYDKNCENHIRISFRLPPMFLGLASDFNFATAYTAYLVAEAQVFVPEREAFDGVINATIMKALGAENYDYRSLPLTLVDVQNQLKALEMVMDKMVDGEQVVTKLNEITGLSLTYKKQESPISLPQGPKQPANNDTMDGGGPEVDVDEDDVGTGAKAPTRTKKAELVGIVELASQWSAVLGLDGKCHLSDEEVANVKKQVVELKGDSLTAFMEVLASKSLSESHVDPEGLGDLCGCASHLAEV